MPTLETILNETREYFATEDITKHREARRIAAYLARKLTPCTREIIATVLGWKCPTSVTYQVKSTRMFMARTAEYRTMVSEIERRCVEAAFGKAA